MVLDYVIRYKVYLHLFVCTKNFSGNEYNFYYVNDKTH